MIGTEVFHCLQVRRVEEESGALTACRNIAAQWARSPKSREQLYRYGVYPPQGVPTYL